LNAFDRALAQVENERRADRIDDVAMAMWGGKKAGKRSDTLRRKG
jgi:hypothetical protein